MGIHDEPSIHNSDSLSEPKTAIQNPLPTEGKTLLHPDLSTGEAIEEPTRKLTPSPDNQGQTKQKREVETEPSKILPDRLQQDKANEPPDENELGNYLRFKPIV